MTRAAGSLSWLTVSLRMMNLSEANFDFPRIMQIERNANTFVRVFEVRISLKYRKIDSSRPRVTRGRSLGIGETTMNEQRKLI